MKKVICFSVASILCIVFCYGNIPLQDSVITRTKTKTKTHHASSKIKIRKHALAEKGLVKYGIASFYAKKFNGRKTSTGAHYNSTILTAACNVLPLGTWVKVTNLKNNKTVIVEINDHLHRKNKRLIDLSKSAAQKLGFISKGITRVKVEVLGNKKPIIN